MKVAIIGASRTPGKIGNILTLAVTNPYDVVKLDDIRIVTGCDLRLVLTLEEALKDSLDRARVCFRAQSMVALRAMVRTQGTRGRSARKVCRAV